MMNRGSDDRRLINEEQSELAAGSSHVYWSLMQIYEKGQLSEFMRE